MTVHLADLLGVQIDLITRGVPLPITAERRLFDDAFDEEPFDDEVDDDSEPRRDDDSVDLVDLFRRCDR